MCGCLLSTPCWGSWPTTWASTLDWDWNWWPFGLQVDSPPSHTSRGWKYLISNCGVNSIWIFFFKSLFIFRGEGREKESEKKSMWGCLSYAPYWGPGPRPRHVLWLGVELATLWFTGWCSVHWAIPARAGFSIWGTNWVSPRRDTCFSTKFRFLLF